MVCPDTAAQDVRIHVISCWNLGSAPWTGVEGVGQAECSVLAMLKQMARQMNRAGI